MRIPSFTIIAFSLLLCNLREDLAARAAPASPTDIEAGVSFLGELKDTMANVVKAGSKLVKRPFTRKQAITETHLDEPVASIAEPFRGPGTPQTLLNREWSNVKFVFEHEPNPVKVPQFYLERLTDKPTSFTMKILNFIRGKPVEPKPRYIRREKEPMIVSWDLRLTSPEPERYTETPGLLWGVKKSAIASIGAEEKLHKLVAGKLQNKENFFKYSTYDLNNRFKAASNPAPLFEGSDFAQGEDLGDPKLVPFSLSEVEGTSHEGKRASEEDTSGEYKQKIREVGEEFKKRLASFPRNSDDEYLTSIKDREVPGHHAETSKAASERPYSGVPTFYNGHGLDRSPIISPALRFKSGNQAESSWAAAEGSSSTIRDFNSEMLHTVAEELERKSQKLYQSPRLEREEGLREKAASAKQKRKWMAKFRLKKFFQRKSARTDTPLEQGP